MATSLQSRQLGGHGGCRGHSSWGRQSADALAALGVAQVQGATRSAQPACSSVQHGAPGSTRVSLRMHVPFTSTSKAAAQEARALSA